VVDNRTGPLVRRISANTNATSIEASVTPPPHMRTFEAADLASISQHLLNAVSADVQMTRIARNASSLRWQSGSSILLVTLSKKTKEVPKDVAKQPDGSPIEIQDKWVRWRFLPLSDFIWEPTNISSDIEDHHTFLIDRVLSIKEFHQEFGKPEDFGFATNDLPTIGDLSPAYIQAAQITGTTFFQSFSRRREEKGVRIVTLHAADPRDPTRWPIALNIMDVTPNAPTDEITGRIINWDNPESPFGHHQRPVFKLDAFRRDDFVLAWGAPHVMMSDQDRINILESLKFQQYTSLIYGQWLVDQRTADPDQFANDLATGVGGVLRWDSKGGTLPPPTVINPPAPAQSFAIDEQMIAQSMRGQVHITEANLGVGKTHIPKGTQQKLLTEANTVVDNIILRDVDTYSDALKLTLGTIRNVMDGPNRMLARLRDRHGFKTEDLQKFLQLKAKIIPLTVKVRQHSIISRSINERVEQLMMAAQVGAITPKDMAIAMADELERPVIRSHELQLQFCESAVRQILIGVEWPGMPNLDLDIFKYTIEKAMWGLDMLKDEDRAAIKRLQEALLIQKQLTLENELPMQALQQGGQQGGNLAKSLQTPGGAGPPAPQGAPESINPLTSPVGAAGGLPAGLSPEVA